MLEGDTALTPNQGGTGGSYGVARGGVQIRRAAATPREALPGMSPQRLGARQALLGIAATRLGRPAAELELADGVVRARDGAGSVAFGELIGGRTFDLK